MTMELISGNDIEDFAGIKNKRINSWIMQMLGFKDINAFYKQYSNKSTIEFLEGLLDEFKITIKIDQNDLKLIPRNGGFITVSNHPFGGWDGIILLFLILKIRPDFKLMGNFLLDKISPLKDVIIPVNPFKDYSLPSENISGIKKSMRLIKEDFPFGFFPSGEVSAFSLESLKVNDKKWESSIIRLIRGSKKPIIPIYFKGNNSILFNTIGLINPKLRSAILGRELIKKKNSIVEVKIGKIISLKEQEAFKTNTSYGRYLRARTYALDSNLETNHFFNLNRKKIKRAKNIIKPINPQIIINEIQNLNESSLLFSSKDFKIFCSSVENIPNIILEIGRLREQTFRSVGEGSKKSYDLDEYDIYYKHLFIWDNKNSKLVGSYRIGEGDKIMSKYGKNGFYMNSLFKIHPEFHFILNRGLEMGRSFISNEYQKNPIALFLLWKGIFYYLLKNEQYQFLFGPVSISNSYTKKSKKILVDFIKDNFFDKELSKLVNPRKEFKSKQKDPNFDYSDFQNSEIITIDNLIAEIEPNHFKTPILIKKYIKQNAKFIGFNIDPKFSFALDGFLVLNIKDLDSKMINNLSKEIEDPQLKNRIKKLWNEDVS